MDTKLLKQKILDLAIRGKLVAQDPNDEPASVLLEKIKKEKQELIKQGKIKKDKNESTIYVGDDKQHYEKMIEDLPKNWEVIKLNEVLYYEQPTNYIVESTKYNSTYKTPVLTAGKTFILGYTNEENGIYNNLPCIIFDDFTTESKFVDFAFKVKSSAMKILTNNKFTNLKFLYYSMQTIECIADTHKRFWISDYSNKPIYLPPLSEQQRIVEKIEELFAQVDKIEEEKQSLLKLIDRAKEKVLDLAMKGKLVKQDPNDEPASVLLEKIFEEKKKLAKEGKIKLSKDELLPPQISDDNDYYEKLGYNADINWLKIQIRDVLYYEQPTNYIVKNTDYNTNYKTPVLTAGKSFILGYTNEIKGIYNKLPCIIFDDFTTESKYVDFAFKVKSSAMKILSNNSNVNLKYIYFLMKQIKVNFDTHKRYWISDYSKKEIIIPSLNNQNKIVKYIEDFVKYFENIKAELN